MSTLLEDIRKGWAWTGVKPSEIIDVNAFGNVIFIDDYHRYWRIAPEELALISLASDRQTFQSLLENAYFQSDWKMDKLAALARTKVGKLDRTQCYCLKIPAVLGGKYDRDNIAVIDLCELIRSSGDMARQIKDLPDGGDVKLTISD
jgi:hypothetical protein